MNELIRGSSKADGGASATLLIVGLSSIAIVIGVVGFVAGLNARRAMDGLRTELEAQQATVVSLNESVSQSVYQIQQMVRQDLQKMDERVTAMVGKVNKLSEPRPAAAPPVAVAAVPAPEAAAPAQAAPASKPSGRTYTVAEGDTMSRIAGKTGVSLSSLIKANQDLDPQRIRVGQKIHLP